MKYHIHILLFSVFVISSLGFNDAYAIGSLSFEQDRMVINHSAIIYCTGCDDLGDTMDITIEDSDDTETIILHKIHGTSNNYASEFVKFCDSGCGPNDISTAPGETVTVSASGPDSAVADVFASDSFGATEYEVNIKKIKPNSSGVCANYGGDSDGDKICNWWENNVSYPSPCPPTGPGLCIVTSADARPYFLGCNPDSTHWSDACPEKLKADVYYEIDYMLGHKPSNATIAAVADVFKNSNYVSKNGATGINFHAQLDEELPHIDSLPWKGSKNTPGYNQLKFWWFGTAEERGYSFPTQVSSGDWLNNNDYDGSERSEKSQTFHYTIFAHNLSTGGTDPNSSGAAEQPGNDAIISLGSFDGMVGSENQQQGTLLHEIGHNMNLKHGGNENKNCKPNYLSVMSYSLQFPIYDSNRALDFSQSDLDDLVENALNETAGIQESTPVGRSTAYGPSPGLNTVTGIPADWNRNGEDYDNPSVAPEVTPDLNNFDITDCEDSFGDTLKGFKDWERLILKISPLGLTTNANEDDTDEPFNPNKETDDGMLENAQLNELTSEDVIEMNVQRIDSVLLDLEKIPDDDFIGNAANARELYKNDLEEVKTLIRQNIGGNNTMHAAYEKLDKVFLKLDGLGSDDIIKSESPFLEPTRLHVGDVVFSQSHSLGAAGDFLNLDREENIRPTPSPHLPRSIDSPYKQSETGTAADYTLCKEGLELAIKTDVSQKPLCLTPETKEKMIERGFATWDS